MLKTVKLLWALTIALLVFAILLAGLYQLRKSSIVQTNSTMNILKSEAMKFLVSRKLISTVVLEKNEKNIFWGERFGILIAEVEILYGFNLEKITPENFKTSQGALHVKMGEPEVLSLNVKLDSVKYFTKMSGLNQIKDKFSGNDLQDELRKEFSINAEKYFRDRGIFPPRAAMLDELNIYLKELSPHYKIVLE